MNVSRKNIDPVNAIITVSISQDDYKEKVEKALTDLRKKANIPGFRKGMVPKGLIEKQYGKGVLIDQINKLIQDEMEGYIKSEGLHIFGRPLPVEQADFNWDGPDFTFEYEAGLIPEISLDMKAAAKVPVYKIKVSDEYIAEHIDNVAKRFGKFEALNEVADGAEMMVKVEEVDSKGEKIEKGVESQGILQVSDLKDPAVALGKKEGESFQIKASDIKDENKLARLTGLSEDQIKEFKSDLKLTLDKISRIEPHAIDQELFDKVYGEGAVKSEEEFKNRIRQEAEEAFANETNIYMMNQVFDFLIENTPFDLPVAFLKKWIKVNSEKGMTDEQAEEEFAKSEPALRHQLIESKILKDNQVSVGLPQILEKTKELLRQQMAQYGRPEVEDSELMDIVHNVISNQEEVSRIQSMIVREKIMDIFKENIPFKVKEVSLDEFIKAATQK